MLRKKQKLRVSNSGYPSVLHPYWRSKYMEMVKRRPSGADPFVDIKGADARKRLIVVRGAWGCLLLNALPYAPGHLMALPYRQVADLESLTEEESKELMDLVVVGKLLLKQVLKADGFNIGLNQGMRGASGGSIPEHLHWHIVPRWCGDNNFMPVIGGVRLLIRSQQSVWSEMVKAYKKMRP